MVNLDEWQETLYKMFRRKTRVLCSKRDSNKDGFIEGIGPDGGIRHSTGWTAAGWWTSGRETDQGAQDGISTLMPGAQTYCLTPWFPRG